MCTKLMYCFSCYHALELKKYLQYSFDNTTEQSYWHIELTDTKISISNNASLCRVLENLVTINSFFHLTDCEFVH